MKRRVCWLFLIGCIIFCACGRKACEETTGNESDTLRGSEQLAAEYSEIYREAFEDGTLARLDTIREIMRSLGASGYAVVDNENQIDMIHPEVIREFDDSVERGQTKETSMFVVTDDGGFVRYDLTASD